MKTMIKKGIIVLLGLLIGGLYAGTVSVHGAQKGEEETVEGTLEVHIMRGDGVTVTPKQDEVICTNQQLNYSVNTDPVPELYKHRLNADEKDAEVDVLLEYRVVCQYALSTDNGASFGEWVDISGGTFCLIPGAISDGKYCLKFRKRMDYELKSEETQEETVSENSVSDNKAEKKKKEEYEKRRKAAGKIADTEPVHIVESVKYFALLDHTMPELSFECGSDLDSWTCGSIECRVKMNDICSKPSWLRVTCAGERVIDETFQSDSSLSGFEKEFVIGKESSKDEGDELIIEAADSAGNINTIRKTVKIDRTPPVIALEGVDNGSVLNKTAGTYITGDDVNPASVCVGYTIKRMYDGNEETLESSAKTLAELKDIPLFVTDRDGDYSVECRAVDRAGNTSATVKRIFRIDRTPPGVSFEGLSDGEILAGDGALKINAFDNFADSYKVSVKGSLTSRTGTSDLRLAEYRVDGRNSSNTYYFKADGEYSLSVTAEDLAGNKYEDDISFTIDKVAPVIEVSGGLNLKEAMVTNEPPTMEFKVREFNYGSASVSCMLKRYKEDGTSEMCRCPEWVMDGEDSRFTITIDEEGSYELSVRAADAAGNTAGKTLRFTLDMTSPDIDYVDNLNRKYVKSFKLPDNFGEYIKDNSDVKYQTYINSMNYDESSEIDEDGKYILKVSAVDDAGNQAEKTVEFIVDGTLPRVVIDGMADDGSVNKDVPIVLSLYDEDDYFISVKLNGEECVTGERQNTVELVIPDYGDYSIEVEASDKAENILTQTIEARCANASPVAMGASTVRTLKQSEKQGSNKGLRIALIILTVLVLAGSVAVYCIYSVKQESMYQ